MRSAIYTRKSTDEGLEQDFNSLDAQREACDAFIASQKHEGWVMLPTRYDDGGYSGGTIERPALQRLLADISDSKVDVVVVYKIDRLTRSLFDFAKIVEVFDAQGVSFVSVTQAFNTATSMGRLTLNVLLSFAQFEREVTGERIRDKIAASKKKGMWMGGYPPLGYDVKERKLVVNETEAETVRSIFRRYQELRSVRLLKEHLDQAGIVSKRRTATDGRPYGGKSFARGALYHMLQNRLYRGEIVHKNDVYPGEHAPIIGADLWQEVQKTLAANRVDRGTGKGNHHLSLLAGLIYDAHGELMTPSHAVKKGVRYRYYVSKNLVTGGVEAERRGQRLPASHIEALVMGRIRTWLADPVAVLNAVQSYEPDAIAQKKLLNEAARLDGSWPELDADGLRAILGAMITRVQVHPDRVDVTLDQMGVALWLNAKDQPRPIRVGGDDRGRSLTVLTIAARLKRTGIEMRLVVDDGSGPANVDSGLVRLLLRAHVIRARLLEEPSLPLKEIAAEEGISSSYVTRLLRLAFLAPDIVTAIMNGRHPPQLTANRLMDDTRLPLPWTAQRERLCS
ncbi:MAG: recombinase family protein [Methyloceanibacter sp.]|uniref:recombinase family protein n=1 Tax=Methyloceanibacter sp. TaxID=1965321 RepID=UPI003D9B6378